MIELIRELLINTHLHVAVTFQASRQEGIRAIFRDGTGIKAENGLSSPPTRFTCHHYIREHYSVLSPSPGQVDHGPLYVAIVSLHVKRTVCLTSL